MRRKQRTGPEKNFPYYKIQYWDDFSICWMYLPKSFPDPRKAEDFALTFGKRYRIGNKYRIIEVLRNGENTLKTSE